MVQLVGDGEVKLHIPGEYRTACTHTEQTGELGELFSP